MPRTTSKHPQTNKGFVDAWKYLLNTSFADTKNDQALLYLTGFKEPRLRDLSRIGLEEEDQLKFNDFLTNPKYEIAQIAFDNRRETVSELFEDPSQYSPQEYILVDVQYLELKLENKRVPSLSNSCVDLKHVYIVLPVDTGKYFLLQLFIDRRKGEILTNDNGVEYFCRATEDSPYEVFKRII